MSDWELLQAYAKNRSDAAFTELVRRHLNWVYSAAFRQTRDPHLAEDVAQAVFVLLARKADNLRPGTILSGWLFRTTRFVASRALRTEYRRKAREQTAVAMSPTTSSDENENLWNQLTPHLDQAVAALSETDRAAILLRFYEKKPLREVGERLGLSEEAAKKRVSRAIEKLRDLITRRGVVLGGAALAVALAEHTVQAAPASLAAGVVKAATAGLSASAVLPQLARETLQAWRLAKLKLVAGIAAASATGFFLALNLGSGRSPDPTPYSSPASPAVAAVQTNERTPQITPAPAATDSVVSRRVMNIQAVQALTTQPLPDVEIRFFREKQKVIGHTDDHGRYQLDLPDRDPSNLQVTARKDGFVPMIATWRAQSKTFELPREFTFALVPAVPIGGVIQNEQGQPIPGATVSMSLFNSPKDRTDREIHGVVQSVSPMIDGSVVTDVQGRWRYDKAPADASQLYFRLEHPDYINDPMFNGISRPLPDKLHDMTSVMVMKKGSSLVGTVLDMRDRPIQGAKVMQGHDRWGSNYPDTTTDAEGRFRFSNVATGEMILTIQAEGYAPELDTVDVHPQTEPLEIRLAKGQTIRGRVISSDGNPIPGAEIRADTWRKHRSLDWKTTTDATGKFIWTNAPPDEVQLSVWKEGFLNILPRDGPALKPSAEEQIITLLPVPHIRGTVVDADTAQPIAKFRVIPGEASKEGGGPLWQEWQAIIFTAGRYEFPLQGWHSDNLLRIEAEGYQSTNSRSIRAEEGDVALDFQLQKKNWPCGAVHTTDGQPVTNADVFLTTSPLYIRDARPMPGMADGTKTHTGADGSFKLPLPDKPFLLIVTHDYGFAEIHSDTTSFPADVTLQPWGRVEGTFFIGSKPIAGQKISLHGDYRFRDPKKQTIEYFNNDVQTDDNGHFVFERVHPGVVFIEPSSVPVEVKSGETTAINLGGAGRPVVGRIVPPLGETSGVDLSNAVGFVEIKQSGEADIIRQAKQEGLGERDIQERLRQWAQTDAGKVYRQARRLYRLSAKSDGSFLISEVPAGTYSLRIEFREPFAFDKQGNFKPPRRIGWLETDVVIPEIPSGHTDEPLDLGDVLLKPVPKH